MPEREAEVPDGAIPSPPDSPLRHSNFGRHVSPAITPDFSPPRSTLAMVAGGVRH